MSMQIPQVYLISLFFFFYKYWTDLCALVCDDWILLKLRLLSILFEAAPLETDLFIYLVFDK